MGFHPQKKLRFLTSNSVIKVSNIVTQGLQNILQFNILHLFRYNPLLCRRIWKEEQDN